MKMVKGEDECFGLFLGDDGSEIQVRLKYDVEDKSGIPEALQRDKFIMHYATGGNVIRAVLPEELLRDSEGNIRHPRYDLHWSLAEWTYNRPRETMLSKVERQGAGKVGNFCIAEDQLVTTRDRGSVKIRDIKCCDLVWDGVEWVTHEGVIETGEKEVLEYQGLRATALHDVWTEERGKVKLEEACAQSLTLMRRPPEVSKGGHSRDDNRREECPKKKERLSLRHLSLRRLWSGLRQGAQQLRAWTINQVSVSGSGTHSEPLSRERSQSSLFSSEAIQGDDAKVLHRYPR